MRLALRGEGGTIVGLDYRGVQVLAAYDWIQELGWGVVAKIDIAEVRRPLLRAGMMVTGMALLAIALGVGFILRVTSPLIRRIEARTQELEEAHEHLRSHSSQVSLEVERAQRKLAVDLHDGIGQLLALVNIKLGLLRGNPGADTLDSRLDEIDKLISDAREQSREMHGSSRGR
jgi:signal transduction histidine kinase